MNVMIVTACPQGVATRFLAARALTRAARQRGWSVTTDLRGPDGGAETPPDTTAVARADLVILACDIEVDPSRFAGKRVWRTSTSTALKQPAETLREAIAHAREFEGNPPKARSSGAKRGPYKHLLTGVSFMLPMVVAGGLLIALSSCSGLKLSRRKAPWQRP